MGTVDTISQLQECNAELCAMFFNYAGALQRDAPPQAVNELPVQHGSNSGAHTVASIPELASQVHACRSFFASVKCNAGSCQQCSAVQAYRPSIVEAGWPAQMTTASFGLII